MRRWWSQIYFLIKCEALFPDVSSVLGARSAFRAVAYVFPAADVQFVLPSACLDLAAVT
jgi:hypothetical protein